MTGASRFRPVATCHLKAGYKPHKLLGKTKTERDAIMEETLARARSGASKHAELSASSGNSLLSPRKFSWESE